MGLRAFDLLFLQVKVGGMLPRRESSCIGRASRDWHLSTSPQPIEKLLFVTRSLDKALEMSPQPITMRPQLTPLHFHLETHTSAPVWRKPD
ncbi:hypothetical protein JZ751_023118 [Albula glossodonta]|uniref:Uncharacterized protein n=1 Tax=Albula glossodonta TaxID=121402 RepID=A0A8T2PND4_9TELE|nr:hypothetical protein JZ751_023118 [Albula glossodonta]